MTQRILVIDDDAALCESLKDLFSLENLECEVAETAEEGLAMLQRSKPQLVVSDIQLPDMSGFQLCQLLRRDPNGRMTPVVLISGSFTESCDRVQGLELGADDYFPKPFDPTVFLARVKNLLKRRAASKQN